MRIKIRDLNEHLVCNLCGGYLVDATTITECLHSFCRSCIVPHLTTSKCCPRCGILAHKTRPLLNIRSDKTVQEVVHRILPDLLKSERDRRSKFCEKTGLPLDANDQKSSLIGVAPEKTEHRVSLSLDHDSRVLTLDDCSLWRREHISFPKRYLRCYDTVGVSHVNSFVRLKLSREDVQVLTFCQGKVLPETYALMDVAETFSCRSDRPLPLTYMVFTPKSRKRKASGTIENEMAESAKKTVKQSNSSAANSPTATISSDSKRVNYNTESVPSSESDFRLTDAKMKSLISSARFVSPSVTQRAKPAVEIENSGGNMNVTLPAAVTSAHGFEDISCSSTAKEISHVSTFPRPQRQRLKRRKSENSIDNWPQIQKRQRKERQGSLEKATMLSGAAANLSDVFIPAAQSPPKSVFQHGSPWTPTHASGAEKMKRSLVTRRMSASISRNRNGEDSPDARATECIRKIYHGLPESRSSPTPGQEGWSVIPISRGGNRAQLERPSETSTRSQQQHRQRVRPAYRDVQLKTAAGSGGSRLLKYHPPSFRSHTLTEDPHLLPTTRQLASLRQQKILNEIAAAAHGRGRSSRMSDSIRAAVSSLSPRLTSPARMSSSPHSVTTAQGIRFASAQPRFLVPAPDANRLRASRNPFCVNGGFTRSAYPKGTSYYKDPQAARNTGCFSFSDRRDGVVDLCQSTITKAMAQMREMGMKMRSARYQVQPRPSNAHHSAGSRNACPASVLTGASGLSPRFAGVTQKPRSCVSYSPRTGFAPFYRGPTTRPRCGKVPSPAGFRPLSSVTHALLSPPSALCVRASLASALPEQDQPLCLVVKK